MVGGSEYGPLLANNRVTPECVLHSHPIHLSVLAMQLRLWCVGGGQFTLGHAGPGGGETEESRLSCCGGRWGGTKGSLQRLRRVRCGPWALVSTLRRALHSACPVWVPASSLGFSSSFWVLVPTHLCPYQFQLCSFSFFIFFNNFSFF